MAIDVAFTFCKIVVIREAGKRKVVPQAESARKETLIVEVAVEFSCFNN